MLLNRYVSTKAIWSNKIYTTIKCIINKMKFSSMFRLNRRTPYRKFFNIFNPFKYIDVYKVCNEYKHRCTRFDAAGVNVDIKFLR